jgi:HEAT repeat protein
MSDTDRTLEFDSFSDKAETLRTASTGELFKQALLEPANERPALYVLRTRGTLEVFERTRQLTTSLDSRERELGLDVLAQLGAGKPDSERPWIEDSVTIAIDALDDPIQSVRASAAYALGHLKGDRAITALISMKNAPSAAIRHAVAAGLGGSNRDDAVAALIELTRDPDEGVRDWTAFGLGSQAHAVGRDSDEIRDGLRAMLNDSFEEARVEAIWGLAEREDPEGLLLLLRRLESDDVWNGDVQTARDILGVRRDTPLAELVLGIKERLK